MKTAISLPDGLFSAAERAARSLGISRSELYRRALEVFLADETPEGITEALNRVYAHESSELDPVLAAMQWASLPKAEW